MIAILIISLVLQATIFNFLQVAEVKPDLLLIIVVLYGLLYGKKAGILGLVYGLFEDLMLGRYIGYNVLTKGILGFIVGLVEPKLFKDHILVPVIVLLLGTIVYGILSFIVGVIIGLYIISEIEVFARIVIIQAIYNSCLAPLLYGRYYKVNMARFVKRLKR
jgi:rod shape-determining protein MreD